jgi:DNA polymerase
MSETPAGFGSLAEYETLMAEVPAWGAGIPVVAEGWSGLRYRK